MHSGEGAAGNVVRCSSWGHHDRGHHHAVRVDGAARRIAVVEVHGAALCRAEQVGRVAGIRAMVSVEVVDVGVVVQAMG